MKKETQIPKETQNIRQDSVGWMLKRISAQMDQEMTKKLKLLSLNLNQFAILMTLLEEDGLTQVRIGQKICMPGYATTRTIDRLEEQKLVKRRSDKRSKRNRCIYLTDKGKSLAPNLFKIVRDVNQDFLSCFNNDEATHLKNLLKKRLIASDVLKHAPLKNQQE